MLYLPTSFKEVCFPLRNPRNMFAEIGTYHKKYALFGNYHKMYAFLHPEYREGYILSFTHIVKCMLSFHLTPPK